MNQTEYDIIIVGAGAAGLMAMHDLISNGYKVCLMEASDRAGGRMQTTILENGAVMEAGAEFIHGKAPITKQLLGQASVPFYPVTGNMCTIRNGVWFPDDAVDNGFDKFQEKLESIEADCSILQFLDRHFPANEYDLLRSSIINLAEGFDLADISRASVQALQTELSMLDEEQFRIEGGYAALIKYLVEATQRTKNAAIHYNTRVQAVDHREEKIIAVTNRGEFIAKKIILTVSAGVLQSGDIRIQPVSTEHETAIMQLGFGSVIKILLRFKDAFWFEKHGDIGFLLTDEKIPTWWTQLPRRTPLLTGWFGGPRALALSKKPEADIYDVALDSLAKIFQVNKDWIRNEVVEHHIYCWNENEFTKGGYSYNTITSSEAKRVLQQPIAGKIYFAGEAIYSGESQGTVEAALTSGREVARKITEEYTSLTATDK
jgi:monoamine oxidase